MTLKVSDKVVCVDDTPGRSVDNFYFPYGYVEKGVVYVVRESVMYPYKQGDQPAVYLVGKEAIWLEHGGEVPWQAFRFRRLEEIKEENRLRNQEPVLV